MAKLKALSAIAPLFVATIAPRTEKTAEPFYATQEWKAAREACLKRAKYRCEVQLSDCQGRAFIADHIVSRRNGGAEYDQANLRAICRSCDNKLKENHLGLRRRGR